MLRDYPQRLQERYKIAEQLPLDEEATLEIIGRKRGFLLKGGLIDLDKTRKILLNEFRAGKLGLISLDQPVNIEKNL